VGRNDKEEKRKRLHKHQWLSPRLDLKIIRVLSKDAPGI
jgi:hypothetical protein